GDGQYYGSTGYVYQSVDFEPATTAHPSSANTPTACQHTTSTTDTLPAFSGARTRNGYVDVYSSNSRSAERRGSDAATLTTLFGQGGYNIYAYYYGDGQYYGSTGYVYQSVGIASTNTALTSSANPGTPGQPITFTETVWPAFPGAGTPTGYVDFYIDNS